MMSSSWGDSHGGIKHRGRVDLHGTGSEGSPASSPLPRRDRGVVGYFAHSANKGVGGSGFGNIMVQCVYKSFWNLEHYSKTGRQWETITDMLRAAAGGGRSSMLSVEFPTDKDDRHNYTAYYDLVLQPYQNLSVNVLEVGVKKGGGIKMLREYFDKGAHIYGVDIDPGVNTFVMDSHIKIMVYDSSDNETARRVLGNEVKFDIIIDDGNHRASYQMKTLHAHYPLLKSTGVYVIEDVFGFDSQHLERYGGTTWSKHSDLVHDESIVFVFPHASIAKKTRLGWEDGNALSTYGNGRITSLLRIP